MLFDDTIYIADLYSITSGIVVNHDWSKKENIMEANAKVVKNIMVRKTFNPNVYREVVTGILIPVYRKTIKYGGVHSISGDVYYKIPNKPVFIKIYEEYYSSYTTNLRAASFKQVENYVANIDDVEKFKNELNNIFLKAEEYYEKASLKNNYSDNKKAKKLLKSLNRK